jgi:hypothetical protein
MQVKIFYLIALSFLPFAGFAQLNLPIKTDSSLQAAQKVFTLPGNYYYKNLKGFCKLEVKLEQKIKLPIRFRLGSLAYVNKLEGKTY